MSTCRQPPGAFVPVIDRNRCEGKGPCVEACPYEVLSIFRLPRNERDALSLIGTLKGIVHGWRQAEVVRPDACRACGACVSACPERAIRLERGPAASIGPRASADTGAS